MRKMWTILALTTVHFAVSVVLLSMSIGDGIRRLFEGGTPTGVERVVGSAAALLLFPLASPLLRVWPSSLRGPLEYVPFLLNSLLWGAGISVGAAWIYRRRSAPSTF